MASPPFSFTAWPKSNREGKTMTGLGVLFISFLVMIILRVPVFVALGLSSLLTVYHLGLSPELIVSQMFEGMNSFTLVAVPFFLLCGQLMNSTGVTDRLIRLSLGLVGHIRGGLAQVNVLVCMIFAGLSGAAVADLAGVGSVLIPAMVKRGFGKDFTIALTASGASLGVIIPPSNTMIIYGAMAGVSIGSLFLAGAVPGIMLGITMMVFAYFYSIHKEYPAEKRASLREVGDAFKAAFLSLFIPLFVVGTVVAGYLTATEAGLAGVVYTALLAICAFQTLELKKLPKLFLESAITYSLPLMAVASALIFGWLMAYLEAPQLIAGLLGVVAHNPTLTVAFISILYLFLGTFMDAIAAIIIFMPVVQHLVQVSGAHPIHAGLVVIMSLAMGLLTPPFGLCLFLGCALGNRTVGQVMPIMVPFYLCFIFILTIIVLFPGISLLLPRLLMPRFVG